MSKSQRFHPYKQSNIPPNYLPHSFSQNITSMGCDSMRGEKTSSLVSQEPKQTDVDEVTKTCSENLADYTRIYCENRLSLNSSEKEKKPMNSPLHNNLVNDQKVEFIQINTDDENEFSDELPDIEDTFGCESPVKATEYETQTDEYRDIVTPLKKLKLSNGLSIPQTEISESKETPYPVLFTKEHKTRLAKLLSKVKSKEPLSRSNSPTLSSNSQNSERHFMDILDSLNIKGKLPDESDTTESLRTPLPYSDSNSSPLKESCSRNVQIIEVCNIGNSSVECVKSSPKTPVTKERTTEEWVENHKIYVEEKKNFDSLTTPDPQNYGYDLTAHIVADSVSCYADDSMSDVATPYKHKETQNFFCPTYGHHSSVRKVLFPNEGEIDVIESFSVMHISYLDAAIEEGDQFLDFSLDMLKRFVLQKKPTKEIMDMLLHKGLLGQSNTDVNSKSFDILRYVWQMYPDLINIDWELLSNVIDGMTLNKKDMSYTNLQGGLLLNLYVMGLEIDLYIVSLKNREKLTKTFVYKYLSVDASFKNLKKIVRWIDFCLTSASTESLDNQVNLCEGEMLKFNFGTPYKLLCDLDRLLFLGIEISRSCKEAVDRIVDEFRKVYNSIVEVERRKLLLQLLSSDLLVLVLTQRMLEENFDITYVTFPTSFKKLKNMYFSSKPCMKFHKNSDSSVDEKHAADSVEELCFLVFYIVKSYIVCKKRELHEPLHERRNSNTLTEEDEKELKTLADEACQFYLYLQGLVGRHVSTLSTVTEQYIVLLSCLSETKVN